MRPSGIHTKEDLIKFIRIVSGGCKETLSGLEITHNLDCSDLSNHTGIDVLTLIKSFNGSFINLRGQKLLSLKTFPTEATLRTLYLHSNNLDSLDGIQHLELESINVNNNYLKDFKFCPKVSTRINADHNEIESLLYVPENIKELSLKDNRKLSTLNGLKCRELDFLNISYTDISEIKDLHISERLVINHLPSLTSFKDVTFGSKALIFTDVKTIKNCDGLLGLYIDRPKLFTNLTDKENHRLTKHAKNKIIMDVL